MSRDKGKGTKKNAKGKAPKVDDFEEVKEDEIEQENDAPSLYDLLNVPKTATVEEIVFMILRNFGLMC